VHHLLYFTKTNRKSGDQIGNYDSDDPVAYGKKFSAKLSAAKKK